MTIVMPDATPAAPGDASREGATYERAEVLMDTLVAIRVVRGGAGEDPAARVARAFAWFREVEERCSRFDPASEVLGLTARVGTPVAVSPLLYEAIAFALAVARASGGAFDPTIGHPLERRGLDRNYLTRERGALPAAPHPP